jgi:hypothetical protein
MRTPAPLRVAAIRGRAATPDRATSS